jgi:enterochelin esterase family protein
MHKSVAVVVTLICCAQAYAQPAPRKPPQPAPGAIADEDADKSPLVSELRRKLKAGDKSAVAAFWRAVTDAGAPLVEPLADAPHLRLVTFVHRSATAKNVALFGLPEDRAQLEHVDGTDVWLRSFRVRDDSRFVYALAADIPAGAHDFEHIFPLLRADALGRQRLAPNLSLCVLPNAPAQPLTLAPPSLPAGQVHIHRAKSQRLGNERDVYVYTPPGYTPKGGPYPLVVLFDGSGYLTDIPAQTILDNLIADKRIPPTVALLIDPVDRPHELGMGEAFADFVALELVPWVQERYHATSDPRATVVGGLSLGGLESSFAAFRHPDVFGNVLSQSGSYWWFNEGDDPETLTRLYANAAKKPIRFYLEVGLFEGGAPDRPTMVVANRHLRDVLVARGYSVDFATFAGGHHAVSWRGTFGDALAGLIGKVHAGKGATRKPTADLTVQDGGLSLVAAVIRAASTSGEAALQLYTQHRDDKQWVSDENAINQLGYRLMYLGNDPKAAIVVFADNVAHHPQSWNAYDSLGEAYMTAGDKAHAVTAYKQSLALEPHNDNARLMLKDLGAAP